MAQPNRGPLVPAQRGRPGLMSLAYPAVGYRLPREEHLGVRFFETVGQSLREEQFRINSLLTADLERRQARRARELAGRLQAGIEMALPSASLASSLFVRELRLRVVGAVWRLHDELPHLPQAVFTLLPRGLCLSEEELETFDLAREMERLRGDLRRCGAGKAGGCLILFLHGEFNPTTGRWQLHFHGWAAGEMIEVVRHLRTLRRYSGSKRARTADIDGVRVRVRVSRKAITNPAYRLSYLLQSFWSARRSGNWGKDNMGSGPPKRARRKKRIPEPQHARYLLWLDRWSVEQTCLRIGLPVKGGRLQLQRDKVSSNKGAR